MSQTRLNSGSACFITASHSASVTSRAGSSLARMVSTSAPPVTSAANLAFQLSGYSGRSSERLTETSVGSRRSARLGDAVSARGVRCTPERPEKSIGGSSVWSRSGGGVSTTSGGSSIGGSSGGGSTSSGSGALVGVCPPKRYRSRPEGWTSQMLCSARSAILYPCFRYCSGVQTGISQSRAS